MMKRILVVMAIAVVIISEAKKDDKKVEIKNDTKNESDSKTTEGHASSSDSNKNPYNDLETYENMLKYWTNLGNEMNEFVKHFPIDNVSVEAIKRHYLKLDKKQDEEYVNYDRHPDPHVVRTMFYSAQPLLIKDFFKALIPIATEFHAHKFSSDYLLRMTNDYRASKKIADEYNIFNAKSKLKQNVQEIERAATELLNEAKHLKANTENASMQQFKTKIDNLEKVAGEQLKVAKELYLSFAKFTSTFLLLEVDEHRLKTILKPVEESYKKLEEYLKQLSIDEKLKNQFQEHILAQIPAEDQAVTKDIIGNLSQRYRDISAIMDILSELHKEPVSRKCINKLEDKNDLMESFTKEYADTKKIEASEKAKKLVKQLAEHIHANKPNEIVKDAKELQKETAKERRMIDNFSDAMTKLSAGYFAYISRKNMLEDDERVPNPIERDDVSHYGRSAKRGRDHLRISNEFSPEYDEFTDGFMSDRFGRDREFMRTKRRHNSKDEI